MLIQLDTEKLNPKQQFKEQMILVSDNEKVRILAFPPMNEGEEQILKMPIVFIGGWLALTESYFDIINCLREEGHEVVYIETREKNSSTATETSDLTGERMFRDVQEILYTLEFNEPFIMLGHSLGAICSLLQAMDEEDSRFIPSRIIAMQPVIESVIQKEQLAVFKMPTWMFKFMRKIMVKVAPLFSSKLKESEYSRNRFKREFLEADPGKMRKSAIGFGDFSLMNYLTEIDIPVLFLGISKDEQHPVEDAKTLTDMLPRTEFYDLVSEEVAFSTKTAELALEFLQACNLSNFKSFT